MTATDDEKRKARAEKVAAITSIFHRDAGLRCAEADDCTEWVEQAIRSRVFRAGRPVLKVRGVFCADANRAWGREQAAAGRCVRRDSASELPKAVPAL